MPRRSKIKAISNALLVDAASRILSSCQSRRFEPACDIANHSAPTSANTANGIDGSIFIIASKQRRTGKMKKQPLRSWPSSIESEVSPTGVD
jgi:hypothetical protein